LYIFFAFALASGEPTRGSFSFVMVSEPSFRFASDRGLVCPAVVCPDMGIDPTARIMKAAARDTSPKMEHLIDMSF
jgi:hypothetical protein